MTDSSGLKFYSPLEERINIGSHAFGALASVFALLALMRRALEQGGGRYVFSFTLFGLSLIALYVASTAYHAARQPARRQRLRVVDHAAIYILIAGTYTPFTLVTLGGSTAGGLIFAASWLMAIAGVVLKLFFTGRYSKMSTSMYVLMGWMIIFAIIPLREQLPAQGLNWLVAGGLAYTVGAVVYALKSIKFNHALFHVFILVGSACHFIAVYYFV